MTNRWIRLCLLLPALLSGADAALTHNRQSNVATLSTIRQSHSQITNRLYGAFAGYSRGCLSGKLLLSLTIDDLLNSYRPVARGHFRGLDFSMGSLTRGRTLSLTLTCCMDRKTHRCKGEDSSSEIDRL